MAEGRPLYITCPELPPLQELIPLLDDLLQNLLLVRTETRFTRAEQCPH